MDQLPQYLNVFLFIAVNGLIGLGVHVLNGWLAKNHMMQISASATAAIEKMVDAKAGAWVLSQAPGFENQILNSNDPWIVKEAMNIFIMMADKATQAGIDDEKIQAMLAGAMGKAQITQSAGTYPPTAPVQTPATPAA